MSSVNGQRSIVWGLSVFLFSFLILTRFNIDPDLGWHLAIGSRFLEIGEIIKNDPFSFSLPGYEWGNRYFAYQILVAFLFDNLGHIMTAMIFGAVGALGVLILVKKPFEEQSFNFWKFLAVVLGVVVAIANLGLRPHTISFLLFAILLVLCERRFFEKRMVALFWFGFFAIWANLHQAFLVGVFFLLTFMTIDFFWQLRTGKYRVKFQRRGQILVRGLCGLAAVVGGLVTPFHGRLWYSLIDDLFGGKTWMAISEWQPIVIFLPISLLFGLSGIVFVYIFFKKIREIEPAWFLLAAFIFMLPFLAANFVFFWAAIFIFIASRYLDVGWDFSKDRLAKFPLVFSSVAVSVALVLAFLVNLGESLNLETRLVHDGYPVSAVNFLKQENLSQNLFNDYKWGGYLIWQYPEARVFIDGRMTGWRKTDGSYILADYLAINEEKCEVGDQYNIQTVLIEADFENDCFSGFREIYRDSVAKILVKE